MRYLQIFVRRGLLLLPALILSLVMSAGCTSILTPGDPPVRLQLKPALPGPVGARTTNRQMSVAMPLAGQDVDSDNVMLLFNDRELRVLAGVRWAANVPFLVQRGLVEAIDSASFLRGVSDESSGMLSDARLLTDIRDFSLHYTDENTPPKAVLEATFRLVTTSGGQVLGSRTISVEHQATGTNTPALAAAMENALSDMLAQVVPWTAGVLRKM